VLSIFLLLLAVPFVTGLNVVRLILSIGNYEVTLGRWKKFVLCADAYALFGGMLLSWIAHAESTAGGLDAIRSHGRPLHFALAPEHVLTFLLFAILAIIALFLMGRDKKYPPIVTVVIYAFVYIAMALSVVWMIQLWENRDVLIRHNEMRVVVLLLLYPVNVFLISIVTLKDSIERLNDERTGKIGTFIYKSCHSWAWGFVVLIPVSGILIMILTLFGQRPDAIIRVFTETAGWTFSQTSTVPLPPPQGGHYLCTVAATGPEPVVKPLFIGQRHGKPIVVNRQLQIANAFEDIIAEKLPKTHKRLRSFYDKHGYPISKHITTPTRSSVVYIAMKPLEWLFLLVLYTFDLKPENRIQRQYIATDAKEFLATEHHATHTHRL